MTTTDRPKRLMDLFAQALEQPAENREEFLQAEAGDDPVLLDELRSLLAHVTDDGFLESPAHLSEFMVGPPDHDSRTVVSTDSGRTLRDALVRHRVAAGLVVAFLLVLLGMAIQWTLSEDPQTRAQKEAMAKRQVRDFIHEILPHHSEAGLDEEPVIEDIVSTGTEQLARLVGRETASAEFMETVISLLEKSLDRHRQAKSPDSARIAHGHYMLGRALRAADRPTDALPHLEGALAIWERTFESEPDHLLLRDATFELALNLADLQRFDQAEPFFERALRIDEVRLGAEDPHVAEILDGYVTCLRASGQKIRAEVLAARAMNIRRAAGEPST